MHDTRSHPRRSVMRIAALTAAALLACAAPAAEQAPAVGVGAPASRPENVFLWDGFEDDLPGSGWSVDSSASAARLSPSAEFTTQGKRALLVQAEFGAKNWVLIRRAAHLKLPGLRSVLVDARCAQGGLRICFAYKDSGEGWHQSSSIPLQEGWNRDITCPVADMKTQKTPTAPYGSPDEAQELYIVLEAAAGPTADVCLDNLRFEGEPADDWNRIPPKDIEVFQPERCVGRFHKFEVGVQFEGAYGNLFDPDDVLVEGAFTDPDGAPHTIRGFLAGYADSDRFGGGWPIFLIRFAPTQVGRWTFTVRIRNPQGETTSRGRWFYVTDSRRSGFVRVSRTDARCFETDDGQFFYPIGQNVAWAQDYEPYLRNQRDTGQNWVRIWLCPWNVMVEREPGRYDLDDAARLDGIVELAEAYGLRVQLVLVYHGMLTGESWPKNPCNARNGGPCYLASDFFTSVEARRMFKRRLDYIIARWGYSTHIFAWELFNEVDLTQYPSFRAVTDWHREMSAYLQQADPNRHLVTTSVSQKVRGQDLWDIPAIDFVQCHVYGPDMAARALDQYMRVRDIPKPCFIAEYGHGTTLAEADQDRLGAELREALWGTFTLPFAGAAMPWWWDAHVRPNDLTRLFAPLSRFAEGMDRRAQNYVLIETAMPLAKDSEVAVRGLLTHTGGWLWLHRTRDERGVPKGNAVLIPEDHPIALSGMLGGRYAVTIVDTDSGTVVRSGVATSDHGRLVVPLPRSAGDVAVKVRYQGDPTPRFLAGPEPLRLDEERLPAK